MSNKFHQLQKRCKELNLFPCRGKGITVDVLEKMIQEAEDKITKSSSAEENLYNYNEEIYKRVKSSIEEDEWLPLLKDLQSLCTNDIFILTSLINNNYIGLIPAKVSEFVFKVKKNYKILERFLPTILSPVSLNILRVSIGDIYNLVPPLTSYIIPFISALEDAEILLGLYPDLLTPCPIQIEEGILCDDVGLIRWFVANVKQKKTSVNPYCLNLAIRTKNIDILEILLEIIEPEYDDLLEAIDYDNPRALEVLLEDGRVQPNAKDNELIYEAAKINNPTIMKILLSDSRVDPAVNNNETLIKAAELGNVDNIILLMNDPRTDPSDRNNEAIKIAMILGEEDIVEILLRDFRVKEKLDKSDAEKLRLENQQHVFDKIMNLLGPYIPSKNKIIVKKELEEFIDSPDFSTFDAILSGDEKKFSSISHPERLYEKYPNIVKHLLRVTPSQPYRAWLRKIARNAWITQHPNIIRGLIPLLRNRADAEAIAGYVPPSTITMTGEMLSRYIRNGDLGKVVWTLFQDAVGVTKVSIKTSHLLESIETKDPLMVKALLEHPSIDPSANNNEAVYQAAKLSDPSIIRLLIIDSRVDPAVDNNEPLIKAAELGNINTLLVLMADPRTNPSDRDNEAIKMAITLEKYEIAKILIIDPRVREKLNEEQIKEWEKLFI